MNQISEGQINLKNKIKINGDANREFYFSPLQLEQMVHQNKKCTQETQHCGRGGRYLSSTLLFDREYVGAIEAFFAFPALQGKQARRVLPVEVYVAEHGGGAVALLVVDCVGERASEFLEGLATSLWRVLRPFALACYDCVVL